MTLIPHHQNDQDISSDHITHETTHREKNNRRTPRIELIKKGALILIMNEKLDPVTHVRLNIASLLGRYKKISHPHVREHLPEEGKRNMLTTKIEIGKLPIQGVIEVWKKIPESNDYEITKYIKQ